MEANNKRDQDLEALGNLENNKHANMVNNYSDDSVKPKLLDDYQIINNDDLPQAGVLYPESWQFAYRCPTTKEVAIFSTLNENDQPAIMSAIEELIRKCVVIYDEENNRMVSSGQINDCHRTYFLLKLRDFYLPGSPVEYSSICSFCKEPLNIKLTANMLLYPELSEKLVNAFDGRLFTLLFPNDNDEALEIKFLIPTIDITGRIFKHIVKTYRENSKDREKQEDKVVFDKKFLLISPYLYEKGTETIKEIISKYKSIIQDDKLFKCYLEIASSAKFDNLDYIITICETEGCGSEEETQIRFPGGWKNMFIGKKSVGGYFD